MNCLFDPLPCWRIRKGRRGYLSHLWASRHILGNMCPLKQVRFSAPYFLNHFIFSKPTEKPLLNGKGFLVLLKMKQGRGATQERKRVRMAAEKFKFKIGPAAASSDCPWWHWSFLAGLFHAGPTRNAKDNTNAHCPCPANAMTGLKGQLKPCC